MTAATLIAACAMVAATPEDGAVKLAVTTVTIPDELTRLALRDMNGAGPLELVRVDTEGIAVRYLGADGTFSAEDDTRISWPEGDVGWELEDADGDGSVDVAMILGGDTVRVWRIGEDGAFDDGTDLLTDAGGMLPRGVRRVPFLRDVSDDGLLDVVVPGNAAYRIHRAQPGGGFAPPLHVSFEAEISFDVGDPDTVHGRFGEDVAIPWFGLQDVDGDGTTDLVSETEDAVLFHLARPEPSTEPTWRLDLHRLREEMPSSGGVDLEDLLSVLDERVGWRVADVDGRPPNDLIIQQGGTFRIYLGGSVDGVRDEVDQLLKSSGNVLHFLLRDVEGDALPELQILRGEKISLTRVLRLLLVPGALNFDVFTYANTDGEFSLKPSRRTRVALEVPRILAFMEELEETQDELEERFETPARALSLDGDGAFDDVVDVRAGRVLIFRDATPADREAAISERAVDLSVDGLLEAFLLRDLDRLEDGGTKSIDLRDLGELRLTPGYDLRMATLSQPHVAALVTPFKFDQPSLEIVDVDQDGRSDVLVIGHDDGTEEIVQILVTRVEESAP